MTWTETNVQTSANSHTSAKRCKAVQTQHKLCRS